MIPLLPAGIAMLAMGAFAMKSKKPVMTEERQKIYHAALKELKDPDKLEQLSKQFKKVGLKLEGELLQKRADYARLPPETKAEHKAIFRKALASTNRDAVLTVADGFEKMGCTGAAYNLRRYGQQLLQEQAK